MKRNEYKQYKLTEQIKHIVALPRWYPNKLDIQLGIFNQRQLLLLKDDFRITVIFVQAVTDQNSIYQRITNRITPSFTEHIIYFSMAKGPFRKITNFIRFNRAQKLGIAAITETIDAFHIHVPYRTALPAIRAYRKSKTPYFITEHWSGHLNGLFIKKNSLDRMIYRRVLKRASGITTVSAILQNAFKKNTGFDSTLIPNVIEKTTEFKEQKDEPSSFIEILSVGDLIDETKNHSGLLEAFNRALQSKQNLRLTLIGGGPDEKKIHELVQKLNIPSENINLPGRQDHKMVLEAMHKCDFYICNSRYETFGMTIAEALIAGKPVISTKCGGPEEFLNTDNSLIIELINNTNQANYTVLSENIIKMANTYHNYNASQISTDITLRYGKEAVRQKWLMFFQ